MLRRLLDDASVAERRAEIAAFNKASPWRKRGLGLMLVQFGISFTNSLLNQAGALVHVYTDGSVQVNHGGTEMGQGLHTKIQAIAADALGLPPARVRVTATRTDKVPNTSATAASSGTDLNGAAVAAACGTLRARLEPVAAGLLGLPPGTPLRFADGNVVGPDGAQVPFAAVARAAWVARVSLSATGFHATPGIAYDRDAGRGTPFFYYAWGVCAAEVELCGLTGEHALRRVDILHDCGDSLNPAIDRGQVEGAFVQGLGWLTAEELRVAPDGRPLTRGPSTYKVPSAGDLPADWRVHLLEDAAQPGVVGGSKAVGEPPFLLAMAVPAALREAVAAFGPHPASLALPATPEHLLAAVTVARGAAWG
jgi:xanthine dehydrogenase molybdopterin-binding subunit B